jgi:DNA invertase Pin-like site-specific DNA recombinase
MNPDAVPFAKVTAAHRAKLAYVYIRQSSLQQVLRHGESTDLQYQLVERAVQLGWPADRVQIIDDDLGKSGASAAQRHGFQFLIAEVGLGRVGLVISLDASRLARNNSDWYQLIELCSMFGTLIADGEQLYDPRAYHDRLVLGLSGMMSEAELHHIKMRMHAGERHKAARGELRLLLPVGLVRQRDGTVILNPDAEVQARLRLIFSKFTELGSARAVRNYLARAQLRVPSRPVYGPAPHNTVWNPPRASTILRILHNPAYAGAYVYGQQGLDPVRHAPGKPRSGVVRRPMAQWTVCLQGSYPAYISWETYLANQARLQTNQNAYGTGGQGVPRDGKALLQGIVRCGRCGRRMSLRYSGPQGEHPVYRCGVDAQEYGGSHCQEVRALGVDAAVERLVLEALAPERITLALDALEQWDLERQALERQWQFRLERARYDALRAQRQYDAVEPENRLVARALEQHWEDTLRAVETTERDYAAWQRDHQTTMTPQERHEIVAIGTDLPRVWHAETTTNADRKHLLRLVVKEVLVDQKRLRGKVWFQINWHTGASTTHDLRRHAVSYQESSDGDQVQARIHRLHAHQQTDRQIAVVLNAEGYRTTYGQPFHAKAVWYLRKRWGLPNVKAGGLTEDRLRWEDGTYTIRGVVDAVGVTKSTVHIWLQQGRISGTQLGAYMLWRIPLTAEQIGTLRAQAEQVRQRIHPRCASRDPQGAAGGDADSAGSRSTPHHAPAHHAYTERLDTGEEGHRAASVARSTRRHQTASRKDAVAATNEA